MTTLTTTAASVATADLRGALAVAMEATAFCHDPIEARLLRDEVSFGVGLLVDVCPAEVDDGDRWVVRVSQERAADLLSELASDRWPERVWVDADGGVVGVSGEHPEAVR